MDKKYIIGVIQSEVKWCVAHKGTNKRGFSLDYEKGFISGLRQAISLIKIMDGCTPPKSINPPSNKNK